MILAPATPIRKDEGSCEVHGGIFWWQDPGSDLPIHPRSHRSVLGGVRSQSVAVRGPRSELVPHAQPRPRDEVPVPFRGVVCQRRSEGDRRRSGGRMAGIHAQQAAHERGGGNSVLPSGGVSPVLHDQEVVRALLMEGGHDHVASGLA